MSAIEYVYHVSVTIKKGSFGIAHTNRHDVWTTNSPVDNTEKYEKLIEQVAAYYRVTPSRLAVTSCTFLHEKSLAIKTL